MVGCRHIKSPQDNVLVRTKDDYRSKMLGLSYEAETNLSIDGICLSKNGEGTLQKPTRQLTMRFVVQAQQLPVPKGK